MEWQDQLKEIGKKMEIDATRKQVATRQERVQVRVEAARKIALENVDRVKALMGKKLTGEQILPTVEKAAVAVAMLGARREATTLLANKLQDCRTKLNGDAPSDKEKRSFWETAGETAERLDSEVVVGVSETRKMLGESARRTNSGGSWAIRCVGTKSERKGRPKPDKPRQIRKFFELGYAATGERVNVAVIDNEFHSRRDISLSKVCEAAANRLDKAELEGSGLKTKEVVTFAVRPDSGQLFEKSRKIEVDQEER